MTTEPMQKRQKTSACSKSIDDLPAEVFCLILNFIKLSDRLKMRSICKSWHEKINNSRSQKLFSSKESKNFVCNREKHNRIDFEHHFVRVHSSQLHSFINKFSDSIFKTLKDLRIFDPDLKNRSTEFFKAVSSLKHLETFLISDLENLDKEICLSSNTLKYFEIQYIQIKDIQIVLETPRLKMVRNTSSSSLKLNFKYPQSIETLELDSYSDDLDNFKFTNLKQLHVRIISEVNPKFLSNLNNLEILSTNGNFDVFDRIFAQKIKYKRHNLKIYLTGLKADRLDEYKSMITSAFINPYILTRHLISPFMKHHTKLIDNLMLFDSIDYNAIDELDPDLEDDIFKKLTNLQSVYICQKIQDKQKLIKFSRSFSNLACIHINKQLPQDLLDTLPNLFRFLQSFSLGVPERNYETDFIFKFKHLQCSYFNICFKNSKKTLEKFFDLKYFWSISFRGEPQSRYFRDSTISFEVYSNRIILGILYATKNLLDSFEFEEKKEKFIFKSSNDMVKFLEMKELVK